MKLKSFSNLLSYLLTVMNIVCIKQYSLYEIIICYEMNSNLFFEDKSLNYDYNETMKFC